MVQYEAFIRQNETEIIDSNDLLQQVKSFQFRLSKFYTFVNFFRSTMLLQGVDLLAMLLSFLLNN